MQHQTARQAAAQLTLGHFRDSKAAQVISGSGDSACVLRARRCWLLAQALAPQEAAVEPGAPTQARPAFRLARALAMGAWRQAGADWHPVKLGVPYRLLNGGPGPPLRYNSQLLYKRAYFARCSTRPPGQQLRSSHLGVFATQRPRKQLLGAAAAAPVASVACFGRVVAGCQRSSGTTGGC